jgi:hypothetical protein
MEKHEEEKSRVTVPLISNTPPKLKCRIIFVTNTIVINSYAYIQYNLKRCVLVSFNEWKNVKIKFNFLSKTIKFNITKNRDCPIDYSDIFPKKMQPVTCTFIFEKMANRCTFRL